MDTSKIILFCILFFLSNAVFSSVYNFTEPGSGALRSTPLGNTAHSSSGNVSLESGRIRSTPQFTFGTAAGKQVGFTASRLSSISTARVGGALVNFARNTTPLGLGITAATLLCTETDICENALGEFERLGDSTQEGWPTSVPSSSGLWTGHNGATFPSAETSCSDCDRISAHAGACPSQFVFDSVVFISGTTYQCKTRRVSDGIVFNAGNTSSSAGCSTGYTQDGSNCAQDNQPRTPTSDDWDDAATNTGLNDDSVVPDLIAGNQPVPVGAPDPMTPQNFISDSQTTTLRDDQGNITGSQVTERRVDITDVSDASNPNSFDITEKKTVTNYDINNNVTNSETTVINNEQPPPEEPTDYEFDDMPDNEIDSHEFTQAIDNTTWGSGGTCPAPNQMVLSVGTYDISYQPVCDFAIAVKPIVISLASVIGLFIIASIRTS